MQRLALLGIVVASGMSACKQQPVASKGPRELRAPSTAPRPAAPASSRPSRDGEPPRAGFHLVAELPYPITFAPLGSDALLVAGHGYHHLLLSLEGNRLRYRPELAQLDQPARSLTFVSDGGVWPDNAWLALSGSSDAGPSSSDVYQWSGARWVKKHEHAIGVVDLATWRGNPVMQGSSLSVPMLVGQQLDELSSIGFKSLKTTICGSGSGSLLAPIRVHDDAVSVFGYECDPNGAPPQAGMAVVVETWSGKGAKSRRRLPLPRASPSPAQLIQDQHGLLALFPEDGKVPRRLARFGKGSWHTVTELPADFSTISAPGTLELWGVVGTQLRSWRGPDWSVMEMPPRALPPNASWQSVWQRGPGDVWLIAGTPEKSWLFNTADGRAASALPNDTELVAQAEAMRREPTDCPQPFSDVLTLQPHQLGEDIAVTLSEERARRMLKSALAKNPRFAHLKFVRHPCYGEDCVGALVRDHEEADALDAVLLAETQLEPDVEKFTRGGVRCYAPPASEPFAVAR
jgi:hypothetical protein